MNELPEGWVWKKLGEVCDIKNGKNQSHVVNPNGKYPIYGSAGIMGYANDYLCNEGCTIIGRKGNINSPIYVPTKFWNVDTAFGLSPLKIIDNKLLYFFCLGFNFKKLDTSTTIPSLTKNNLLQIDIPLPPLPVQRAIVTKIEEIFSELDHGVEQLKTARQQLKVYRQAVLKWAFEVDKEKFEECSLIDVSDKIQIGPFGTQLHQEDYVEGGIPLINPMHLKNGEIVADNSFTITKGKRDSLPNYILSEGDVIMGRRGEMGRCGLVKAKEDGWFCGTGSLYIRPNKKLTDSKFLYYYLRSDTVKKFLEENAGGTTMANLNLKIVNNIPIYFPPLPEQHLIVSEIERRLSVCDKLEETIEGSLKAAEVLRAGVLKRAFEGRLVR